MALRNRQLVIENAENRIAPSTKGMPSKIAIQRNALGMITNKVGNAKADLGKPVLVKGRVTRSTAQQKPVPEATKVLQPPQLKSDQIEDELNRSLMDISITDDSVQSFSSYLLPQGITDIDSDDKGNEYLCSEYIMDIYRYLRQLETTWSIRSDFLNKQKDITPRMRSILVDWLNQVHTRFSLLQETLFLTVAVVDRFLQECSVSRSQLQLVGITAMFIASKYEEICAPVVNDFVHIADNAYSKRDIFKMECFILKTLQFSLGRPLPLHFLRRYSKAGDCDVNVHMVARFFMELSLQDYELAPVNPSLIAAAALMLSLKIMDEAQWSQDLSFYSGYSEGELKPVVSKLAKLVLRNRKSQLQAVSKKYTHRKFRQVSTLPQLHSETMERLAS